MSIEGDRKRTREMQLQIRMKRYVEAHRRRAAADDCDCPLCTVRRNGGGVMELLAETERRLEAEQLQSKPPKGVH